MHQQVQKQNNLYDDDSTPNKYLRIATQFQNLNKQCNGALKKKIQGHLGGAIG